MVLICNNNILSIDQFHKNRCTEKKEIKDIIIGRKYNTYENEKKPYINKDQKNKYSNSINSSNGSNHNSNKLDSIDPDPDPKLKDLKIINKR